MNRTRICIVLRILVFSFACGVRDGVSGEQRAARSAALCYILEGMSKGTLPVLPEQHPKKGEVYKHYKGDRYEVVGLAIHSNDDIWMVVYSLMYDFPDAEFFTRPLSEWYDDVEWEGEVRQRFELVNA